MGRGGDDGDGGEDFISEHLLNDYCVPHGMFDTV